MRIAFMSTFYPFRGGIAQFNANLYDVLAREHEVKAFNFTCQYPSVLFPGKTQFVSSADDAKPVENERVLNSANPLTYLHAARKIAAWKPDLVIFRYWMTWFAPSLGTVARYLRRRGIKVIAILDNVVPHEPKFYDKPFSKWFLKQFDGLITMSSSVLADMKALYPKANYIHLFHPLYNHFGEKMPKAEAQRRLSLESNLKTLLFFGLIRDYKGLDILLDAFPKLGDGYQLVIAGECYGSFDKYAAQIEASGCGDRIKVFERYIPDEEVPLFFSAADLCTLPYRSATQSGITAVSLHFGVPIVATRTGGLEETIEKPGIGVMAESITPEGVADAIKRFFEKNQATFAENIVKAKEGFSWERFADELLKFYATILCQ